MLSQDWVKLQPQIYICIFIHHGTSAEWWLKWCVLHFPWSRSYFGVMSHSWVQSSLHLNVNKWQCVRSWSPFYDNYKKKAISWTTPGVGVPLFVTSVRYKVTSVEFYLFFHLTFFPHCQYCSWMKYSDPPAVLIVSFVTDMQNNLGDI